MADRLDDLLRELARAPDAADFAGNERFEVVRRIGSGGMGVVYEALDRQRGARVALKTLRELSGDAVYRLKGEFRALAGLHHPNLIRLGELVLDGDRWFFSMELLGGVDALGWTRPGGRLALERLRSVLGQLTEALGFLHAAGVAHLDLKPSNVMVEEGRVVVLDFGLATELLRPAASAPTGTPAYMAPEQIAGEGVGAASDWYALGVMLFEALTGRLPFRGTVAEMLAQKQREAPPRPAELDPAAPDLAELCVELLARDPAERPAGSAIAARLGSRRSWRPVATQPLVGRLAERRALLEACERAHAAGAVLARVHGPSGIGKTALVTAALADLRERFPDALVLSGRCYLREVVPFKAFDGILDALGRELLRLPDERVARLLPRDVQILARLFPSLRQVASVRAARERRVVDAQQLRKCAFSALRELLGRLGDERLLVLAIDDLQWGDLDSIALLRELLRPPDSPQMLVVSAYRDEDAGGPVLAALAELAAAVDGCDLPLRSLDPRAAHELVRLHLGVGWAAEVADAIVAEAGGNPMFLAELAHTQGTRARAAVSLDELLVARIAQRPAGVRRLLALCALAAGPLERAVARRAAFGADARDEEAGAVADLSAGRLLRLGVEEPQRLEPYHDRVREAVLRGVTPDDERELHAALAQALEEVRVVAPERLAYHLQRAGRIAEAARCLQQAGDAADQALAFDLAASCFRQALELGALQDEAHELSLKLGEALARAGRGAEAARVFLGAADDAASADAALDHRRRAGEQLVTALHIDEGMAVLAGVLRQLGITPPRSSSSARLQRWWARARLWLRGLRYEERAASELTAAELMRIDACWTVVMGIAPFDVESSRLYQSWHLLLALRAGEPFRLARALGVEARFVALGGRRAEARTDQLLGLARLLAHRDGSPLALGSYALMDGLSSHLLGRWPRAAAVLREGVTTLHDRCTGVTWELKTSGVNLLTALRWCGAIRELSGAVPGLLQDAEQRGDAPWALTVQLTGGYFASLAADQPARARAALEAAALEWPAGFHMQRLRSLHGRAHVDLYEEGGAAAHALVEAEWPAFERSPLFAVECFRLEGLALRATCALAAGALEPCERSARALAVEGVGWVAPLVELLRALVARARGEDARAVELMRDAEAGFEAAQLGLHAAAARWRLGEWLGGERGAERTLAARSWMEAQAIADPRRMTALLAPEAPRGLARREPQR